MPQTNQSSLAKQTFSKLKRLYIIALSAIAISAIASHILIQQFLNDQQNDSTVINVAGRQRMLSQKLTKEAYQLLNTQDKEEQDKLISTMRQTVSLWSASHNGLLKGNKELGLPGQNSEQVNQLYRELQPFYEKMEQSATYLIQRMEKNPDINFDELRPTIKSIFENESEFLRIMDQIVNQYDEEANAKVNSLIRVEILILAFTIIVLLCEFLFIFFPTARAVEKTIMFLVASEKEAKKMAYHADQLSQEKDKSVRELSVLNQAINQTLLFARVLPGGEIIYLGEKFSRLFKLRERTDFKKFYELLSTDEKEQKYFETLLYQNARSGWQGEVKTTSSKKEEIWLEMSLIPYYHGNDAGEILVIAIDITAKKEAQLEIERLAIAQYEEKMNQQKLIASKIIENQENEQNRIAKDIHDGIGQMLTALSLHLESIDISNIEKTSQKIENLKELTSDIIKGVRTATFNLMPPELSDHGIVPALNKLVEVLSKLTNRTIFLYNKTKFSKRLDALNEINIYRITQEAINNAIKYSGSDQIVVTVSHGDSLLSINVDDNGKGFDVDSFDKKEKGTEGRGLNYMKERIKYINGRIFINSEPGKGTRITINIPLG